MSNEYKPIASAPKDRKIIFGGRYKPFDILPGGDWTEAFFQWSTLDSINPKFDWYSGFNTMDHWNVEWTHWTEKPEEPKDG